MVKQIIQNCFVAVVAMSMGVNSGAALGLSLKAFRDTRSLSKKFEDFQRSLDQQTNQRRKKMHAVRFANEILKERKEDIGDDLKTKINKFIQEQYPQFLEESGKRDDLTKMLASAQTQSPQPIDQGNSELSVLSHDPQDDEENEVPQEVSRSDNAKNVKDQIAWGIRCQTVGTTLALGQDLILNSYNDQHAFIESGGRLTMFVLYNGFYQQVQVAQNTGNRVIEYLRGNEEKVPNKFFQLW